MWSWAARWGLLEAPGLSQPALALQRGLIGVGQVRTVLVMRVVNPTVRASQPAPG